MKINTICKFSAAAAAALSLMSATPVHSDETINQPENSRQVSLPALANTNIQKNKLESNAVFFQSGFVNIDGEEYYIDGFGQKTVGSAWIDGDMYFFNALGQMEKGFVEFDGHTFYFNEETGVLESGKVEVDGETFYLQSDGELLNGWKERENGTSYYNEDGSRKEDEIVKIDNVLYSFDEKGYMETNVSRDIYDFDENGAGRMGNAAYQKIADAALAQLGVHQDCTMLVTNSLKAVGINFHGAPYKYLSLGPTTNNPVPGDIIVYQGHVAIYVGNGQAVHGGWLGYDTVLSTVECTNAFVAYVHPNLPIL